MKFLLHLMYLGGYNWDDREAPDSDVKGYVEDLDVMRRMKIRI